jgi:hypothetical protein
MKIIRKKASNNSLEVNTFYNGKNIIDNMKQICYVDKNNYIYDISGFSTTRYRKKHEMVFKIMVLITNGSVIL